MLHLLVFSNCGHREALTSTADDGTTIPATKTQDYWVSVDDDVDAVFMVQEATGGTPFTTAEVGLNANLVAAGGRWEISQTTPGTGATLQVRLLGLVQQQNNEYGDFAKWRVTINTHELARPGAGI